MTDVAPSFQREATNPFLLVTLASYDHVPWDFLRYTLNMLLNVVSGITHRGQCRWTSILSVMKGGSPRSQDPPYSFKPMNAASLWTSSPTGMAIRLGTCTHPDFRCDRMQRLSRERCTTWMNVTVSGRWESQNAEEQVFNYFYAALTTDTAAAKLFLMPLCFDRFFFNR